MINGSRTIISYIQKVLRKNPKIPIVLPGFKLQEETHYLGSKVTVNSSVKSSKDNLIKIINSRDYTDTLHVDVADQIEIYKYSRYVGKVTGNILLS